MKNSTLLRLFFISIGLPLTCASSSSASTSSSAITLKPKRRQASLLADTTNSVEPVQPKEHGIMVIDFLWKCPFIRAKWRGPEDFQELLEAGKYWAIIKIGEGTENDEFLKCLRQVVISLDNFKGLYEYLEQRRMVPDFLAHGKMVLVRKVIVETDLLKTNHIYSYCNDIYEAITLSLEEDRPERVADLFEAARERPAWNHKFDVFVSGFFFRYPPEKNGMPLKRFLSFHGEALNKKYPGIFQTICGELVWNSRRQSDISASKLLIDLVGQPSLLTPVAFAGGFLDFADDTIRAKFIRYGYKEAIEEGLKEEYERGGRDLWRVMVSKFKNQFSGEYPSTDEARTVALKNLPTKQDREEEWAERNAPNPRTKLRARQLAEYLYELDVDIPIVLWVIVAEYLTVPTWLDIE